MDRHRSVSRLHTIDVKWWDNNALEQGRHAAQIILTIIHQGESKRRGHQGYTSTLSSTMSTPLVQLKLHRMYFSTCLQCTIGYDHCPAMETFCHESFSNAGKKLKKVNWTSVD